MIEQEERDLIRNMAFHISKHNFEMNQRYGLKETVLIPSIMCQLYDNPIMIDFLKNEEI